MPLRSREPICFIMALGSRAVSHWTAKDATLSLQGWVTSSHGTGTESKLPLDTNWLITFQLTPVWQRSQNLSQLDSVLIIWDRKLLMSLVASQYRTPHLLQCPRVCSDLGWIHLNFLNLFESSFNHSDHFKYYCFQPPFRPLEPNRIK